MREAFSATTLTRDQAEILEVPEVRSDGMLKTTGRARYMRDFALPGMLWASFLMSPHPHARIVSIDTTAAKAVPGVHAVLTGDDIGRKLFGRQLYDWPVLAYDRVRFVGERVAAVAAETPSRQQRRRLSASRSTTRSCRPYSTPKRRSAPTRRSLHPDWQSYYPQGRAPELRASRMRRATPARRRARRTSSGSSPTRTSSSRTCTSARASIRATSSRTAA